MYDSSCRVYSRNQLFRRGHINGFAILKAAKSLSALVSMHPIDFCNILLFCHPLFLWLGFCFNCSFSRRHDHIAQIIRRHKNTVLLFSINIVLQRCAKNYCFSFDVINPSGQKLSILCTHFTQAF